MLIFSSVHLSVFSHACHCCSTSIHPLSELSILVPVSLRSSHEPPSLIRLLNSHRPEQAPATLFPHELQPQLCDHYHAGNVAECNDYIVTLQH